ncbi:MAG TPA: F0F1 ATP synthase subunit delta [Candidatus Saccharimonadales bacterium]|nr:F0F1 ATP synthase subunit delta [Candidatus Saccharimonadales bacterium]
MKAPRTKLAAIVADRTLAGGNARTLSRELAAYLLSEGRADELESILRDVQADWAEAGYVEVLARSAYPLTSENRAEIQQQVSRLYPSAKQIVVTEVRDPEVIGGVQIRLSDRQLDLSVEHKLNRFKQLTTNGKE